MRVLQLGRFGRIIGGVQAHAQMLCRGLAARGLDVVNLVAAQGSRGSEQRIDGYRLVEAGSYGIYLSTALCPDMVRLARRLHREAPFDVVHLHFPDPMSHLVSLALHEDVPRVITWHSDIVRQRTALRLYRPVQVREVMRAKALVAPTSAHFSTSGQIPPSYPQHQKHVIPFGIELERFAVTPQIGARVDAVRRRAAGRPIVFALGRHVAYKGFDVLIDAIAKTRALLVLGGDGPLTPDLKLRVEKAGVEQRVVFPGVMSEDEVVAHYHACDMFCLPSVTPNEALGIVQLEAMACGKPVICTALGNGVNVVNPDGVTGLTVPVGDARALAEAIEALSDDIALRVRLGAQAQARIVEDYSLDAMSERHLMLYRDLIMRVARV